MQIQYFQPQTVKWYGKKNYQTLKKPAKLLVYKDVIRVSIIETVVSIQHYFIKDFITNVCNQYSSIVYKRLSIHLKRNYRSYNISLPSSKLIYTSLLDYFLSGPAFVFSECFFADFLLLPLLLVWDRHRLLQRQHDFEADVVIVEEKIS